MTDWRNLFGIDRQSKMPLYHQISENLRGLITSGQLQPGQATPSEWELSEMYGVSRLTVRRALGELAREGWLTRRHGVGTFVTSPAMVQVISGSLGFTQKMRLIGRSPSSHLISIKHIPATDEVATRLNLDAGAAVTELVRVRLADAEPIMLETACVSQARFPDLTEGNLGGGSLYEFLSRHYQVIVVAVDQTLAPVLLTAQQAQLLDARAGSPALLSEVVAFAEDATPIEYSWSVTRGDSCRFYFRFREGDAGE